MLTKRSTAPGDVNVLRDENISSHAHKTGSWYLLGILVKISKHHPALFIW